MQPWETPATHKIKSTKIDFWENNITICRPKNATLRDFRKQPNYV